MRNPFRRRWALRIIYRNHVDPANWPDDLVKKFPELFTDFTLGIDEYWLHSSAVRAQRLYSWADTRIERLP